MDGTEDRPITIQGSGDPTKIKMRGNDKDDWRVLHIRHDHYIVEVRRRVTNGVILESGGRLISINKWVDPLFGIFK